MKTKIVVFISGGIMAGAWSNSTEVDVELVDADNLTTETPQGESSSAYVEKTLADAIQFCPYIVF